MLLHHLKPSHPNKRKKPRVGRGGKRGTTSGHGTKGQKSRAGRRMRPAERDFIQRLPKLRGVKNKPQREKPLPVNLKDLAVISGDIVSSKSLFESGIIKNKSKDVKILGSGEINKPMTFENISVSRNARMKIEKAGGKIIQN